MTDNIDPHFDEDKIKSLPIGRVLEKQRGEYSVRYHGQEIICGIRSRLRKSLVYPLSRERRQSVDQIRQISQVDPVAVGDSVRFESTDDAPNVGVIEFVESRKNQLSRRDPGQRPRESVICANVDNLILVFAFSKPASKTQTIDRFMLSGAWEDIPTFLVMNKVDLADDDTLKEKDEIYAKSGCTVLHTSAITGEGVESLREIMHEKTSVMVGPSGVGKSTLLNCIDPDLNIRTQKISDKSSRGKHTTTEIKAFPLGENGLVVDTPGIKSLALWNLHPDDLITLYPEMAQLQGKCKFGLSCMHETEPGCAVKDALARGEIHVERYESFLSIRADLEKMYGKEYEWEKNF